MPFPNFSRAELYADGAVHTVGMVASAIAVTILLILTAGRIDGGLTFALGIYGFGLFAMFACSAAYNLTPWQNAKAVFRRFDHAAIFLMIAGTYTPLTVLIGTPLSAVMLAIVWIGAIGGATSKLIFGPRWQRFDVPLYLALGWCGIVLIGQMFLLLSPLTTVMILLGGLCYSVGVVFHMRESMHFHNVIWHVFVTAGATFHFIAVAHGTAQVAV